MRGPDASFPNVVYRDANTIAHDEHSHSCYSCNSWFTRRMTKQRRRSIDDTRRFVRGRRIAQSSGLVPITSTSTIATRLSTSTRTERHRSPSPQSERILFISTRSRAWVLRLVLHLFKSDASCFSTTLQKVGHNHQLITTFRLLRTLVQPNIQSVRDSSVRRKSRTELSLATE
jgi:hypothetical protein